jgi:hypothetical protein
MIRHRGIVHFASCAALSLAALFACSGGGGGRFSPSAVEARWSDPATWPNGEVPGAGANVHIGAGQSVLLDVATAPLDMLRIEGSLRADPTLDVAITASAIEVLAGGELAIGSETAPHAHAAVITLTGASGVQAPRHEDNALDNDGVQRALRVMPGGVLRLFGAVPALLKTKLADHANAGSKSFAVADAVQWRAGDRIAISTTDFHGVGQTEMLTLANDSAGTTLQTVTGLQSFRWGKLQYPLDAPVAGRAISLEPGVFTPTRPTQATVLDERAEVVDLTRRIVIQGADDAAWSAHGFGAHVMVMGLASSAQVAGVEFRRCGQRRAMGRYPLHWHMLSYTPANDMGQGGGEYVGDAAPGSQFVRDSAIWGSENRGVTIHGTCGVTVSNVFAVDIKGHAFFLEDGSEMHNTITGCVAMKVRTPAAVDRIKVHDTFASGFWITNPVNAISKNSASDCDGRGFWNSFANVCFGLSRHANVAPGQTVVLLHEDNVGHGNHDQGITTEFVVVDEAGNTTGQRYQPDGPFTLSRNVVWKNNDGGYLNRVAQAQYIDWTAADNNTRDFQGQTMAGAVMRGTLLVGKSLNSATPFADPHRIGVSSYHFSLDVEDITALEYPFVEPTIAANSQFVYGGGVFDASDLYDRAIGLGMLRNSGWHIVNSNAGFVTPPPFFDGFPLSTFVTGRFRYWTLPGALWDPHGYWGPAGNYVIPNKAFFTFGLTNLVPVAPAGSNGMSTPTPFYGVADIVLDNETAPAWGGPSLIALRLARWNASNVEIGQHTVGDPNLSLFFPGMRYFSVVQAGRYKLTFPGGRLPTTELRIAIDNCWRATDQFVIGVPWPGNQQVVGRLDSGFDNRPVAQKVEAGIARLFVPAANLAAVVDDPTGASFWQDTAANTVWVKPAGGLALNVYGYDGRSEESLRRTQVIYLQRP